MQAKGQAGNNQDNGYDFLWVLALIFSVILLIWYFGRTYIAIGLYQVKFYEIQAIQYILAGWNMLASKIHVPIKLTVEGTDLQNWLQAIRTGRAEASYEMMMEILEDVGKYLRFPIALVLVILS